jgi:DNA-binding NtrC family response regulator
VRDLGSTNGTYLNGARVDGFRVEKSTTFAVGKTRLSIRRVEEDLGVPKPRPRLGDAVGDSVAMRELFGLLSRLAKSDATVVLLGETGTGKELLARAIHAASPRARKPFEVLDARTLSPTLAESELFGHVRGAFTGATADRAGVFERAHGGTVLLDCVGELSLELQPLLLRVLETRAVTRVGANTAKRVDVRVIATHLRPLDEEVKAGRLREDLFYRLGIIAARVPPLRERLEDLVPLIRRFEEQLGRPELPLHDDVLEKLRRHPWPGNVRELRNLVEAALDVRYLDRQPSRSATPAAPELVGLPFKEAKDQLLRDFTRDYFRALLERAEGNRSRAAKMAGIARAHLYTLLDELGLNR